VRRATVLIADDHTIVLEGLVSLLKDRFDVVGAVADGRRLLDEAARLRPDVIVTDISMPGVNGLEVLRRLKAEQADVKVIVLTMHARAEVATEAMRAGASGFVVKQSAGEELISAINAALQGRVYLTPAVTRDVVARISAGAKPETPLTPRQLEVLRLVAEGRRMKEIAGILNLSTRTVETHKYEMMQALGLQSTAELVRYAIQHRLIDDSGDPTA
jgi:DNA-binding NarL/FixJ family response regulator